MSALLPLIHYHSREHRGDAFFFSGGIMPPGHELRRARARIEEKNEEEVVGLARSRRGFCFLVVVSLTCASVTTRYSLPEVPLVHARQLVESLGIPSQ